jgi:hypothetical protein
MLGQKATLGDSHQEGIVWHEPRRAGVARQIRRRQFLHLLAPLPAVLVAGCSKASPFRARPSSPGQTPTPTAASTGTLRSLFPPLGGLASAQSVTLERRWIGFAIVYRRSETYSLVARDADYAGNGVVGVAGRGGPPRTETRPVTVPRDAMQAMLGRLPDATLDERPYAPKREWTDDYPEIELRVVLSGASVRFFTQSQGEGNVPWGVEHAGRTFVVRGDTVHTALKSLEAYLLADRVREMAREMEDEARPPRKP